VNSFLVRVLIYVVVFGVSFLILCVFGLVFTLWCILCAGDVSGLFLGRFGGLI
jgi:hypothetical protein